MTLSQSPVYNGVPQTLEYYSVQMLFTCQPSSLPSASRQQVARGGRGRLSLPLPSPHLTAFTSPPVPNITFLLHLLHNLLAFTVQHLLNDGSVTIYSYHASLSLEKITRNTVMPHSTFPIHPVINPIHSLHQYYPQSDDLVTYRKS